MKGYMIVAALAALVVTVFAEDHPILPIPTKCPAEDSPDYTVHLRHEDCTKYYACLRGQPIEMSCPFMNEKKERLHFNALLQVCDWPSKAGCVGGTTPVVVTDPTPPNPAWNSTWVCKNAKDGVMLPHETRCYYFYKCINQVPILQSCPEGLGFDPYRQTCDNPNVANCVVKNACRYYNSNVGKWIPDPESCKYVYYCKGDETTHYPCEVDAEWSVELEKCVTKEKANCVRRYDY